MTISEYKSCIISCELHSLIMIPKNNGNVKVTLNEITFE